MTGREIFLFGVGGGFGVCLLGLVGLVQKANNHQSGILYSYEDLRKMKAECEQDLPRNVECSVVVYYLPQAELEKTE